MLRLCVAALLRRDVYPPKPWALGTWPISKKMVEFFGWQMGQGVIALVHVVWIPVKACSRAVLGSHKALPELHTICACLFGIGILWYAVLGSGL